MSTGWRHWWIDPDGDQIELPVGKIEGVWSPPTLLDTIGVYGEAGERRLSQIHGPREIPVPLGWEADTEDEHLVQMRAWADRLNTTDGVGIYRRQLDGRAAREIVCSVGPGLEAAVEDSYKAQLAVVRLIAHEPYWRDAADTVETFTLGEGVDFFPLLPVNLISADLFGEVTVVNVGSVQAWPVWTIDGPGDSVTLTNDTTGESLTYDAAIADGESLVIDTRPEHGTVEKDSVNVYQNLTTASALWPFEKGSNAVTITVPSATGDTQVQLAYRLRYLTP